MDSVIRLAYKPGDKVYLKDGEDPPPGTEVQEGPRGGRYFEWRAKAGHGAWENRRRLARRAAVEAQGGHDEAARERLAAQERARAAAQVAQQVGGGGPLAGQDAQVARGIGRMADACIRAGEVPANLKASPVYRAVQERLLEQWPGWPHPDPRDKRELAANMAVAEEGERWADRRAMNLLAREVKHRLGLGGPQPPPAKEEALPFADGPDPRWARPEDDGPFVAGQAARDEVVALAGLAGRADLADHPAFEAAVNRVAEEWPGWPHRDPADAAELGENADVADDAQQWAVEQVAPLVAGLIAERLASGGHGPEERAALVRNRHAMEGLTGPPPPEPRRAAAAAHEAGFGGDIRAAYAADDPGAYAAVDAYAARAGIDHGRALARLERAQALAARVRGEPKPAPEAPRTPAPSAFERLWEGLAPVVRRDGRLVEPNPWALLERMRDDPEFRRTVQGAAAALGDRDGVPNDVAQRQVLAGLVRRWEADHGAQAAAAARPPEQAPPLRIAGEGQGRARQGDAAAGRVLDRALFNPERVAPALEDLRARVGPLPAFRRLADQVAEGARDAAGQRRTKERRLYAAVAQAIASMSNLPLRHVQQEMRDPDAREAMVGALTRVADGLARGMRADEALIAVGAKPWLLADREPRTEDDPDVFRRHGIAVRDQGGNLLPKPNAVADEPGAPDWARDRRAASRGARRRIEWDDVDPADVPRDTQAFRRWAAGRGVNPENPENVEEWRAARHRWDLDG